MANKIILTTEQHEKLLNHIVSEVVTESVNLHNEDGTINEGVWEKVKYGLSKLGRYKANGKIFGKGKIDKEAAAQIQSIINKQGNELIRNLDANIKQNNPKFPNNEKGNDFLNTVMEISSVYDSIIAGVGQNTIPADAANGIINDLRAYVKKYLDVDLTAAYSVVDEAEGNTLNLTEEEGNELDEAWELGEAKRKPNPNQPELPFNQDNPQGGEPEDISPQIELNPNDTSSRELAVRNNQLAVNNNKVATTNPETGVGPVKPNNQVGPVKPETGLEPRTKVNVSGQATPRQKQEPDIEDLDYQDVHNAKDVRAKLQAKRGAGGKDFASTRMDTLKSNKLPMTLVGVGASLGAFSWLVNTEWFKTLFQTISKTPTVEMIKSTVANNTEIIGNIKPGQGLTQLMNAMNHAGITPNTTPEQFLEQVKILGGGDINAGINALATKGGIFVDPASAKAVLADIAQNPHGHGNTLGQIFKGKWAGTGRSVGDMLTCRDMGQVKGLIAGTLTKAIPTIVMKSAVKVGAGYAAAKGLGAILGPIGVAAVATGALVKIMRMKGQKQSRAKTLNDLYQSILNVNGGVGVIKPETNPINIDQASDVKQLGSVVNNGLPQGNEPNTLGEPNNPQKQLGKGQNLSDYLPKQDKNFNNLQPKVKGELGGPDGKIDETYNSLIELFKFITSTEKNKGQGNIQKFKVGDVVEYRPAKGAAKKVKITKLPNENSKVAFVDIGKGKVIDVDTSKLKPMSGQNSEEGDSKFITNYNLLTYLNKELGNQKLIEFEGFLTNVMKVKDTITKVKPTGNKRVDGIVNKLKNNPIMKMKLSKFFDNDINDPEYYKSVKNEVNDLANTIYSSDFKNRSLMKDLLAMSQSNLSEGFKDNEKTRRNIKKNLVIFISDSIALFKELIQMKNGTTNQAPNKKAPIKNNKVSESVETSPVINEHINRIKKIMYKVD